VVVKGVHIGAAIEEKLYAVRVSALRRRAQGIIGIGMNVGAGIQGFLNATNIAGDNS
jgi:hypothetical protein